MVEKLGSKLVEVCGHLHHHALGEKNKNLMKFFFPLKI
jgi:hypothetical protein